MTVVSVGQRIVSLRKQQGLTQAGLAKAAKLSASAIAMYETDRRVPDKRSLEKLATAFGISTVELTEDTVRTDSAGNENSLYVENAESEKTAQISAAPSARSTASDTAEQAVDSEELAQAQTDTQAADTTQLTLTLEEARVILFLRMHPQAMAFIQTYITAGSKRRSQLEKAWRLINEFQ